MNTRGIQLDSGLWIDSPDALHQIARMADDGRISSETASLLRRFHDEGFVAFPLEVDDAKLDLIPDRVSALWEERPHDLLYAFDGPPRRMSVADPAAERRPRSRIHDLHSHVEPARELYLHPRLHELATLILGEPTVAIQSLYFEWGSQQVLHRDPVVVPTGAPGHLLAAWIAIEDIDPGSGALRYVPGSHRLPYYEFAPGQYMFDAATMGEREIREATAWFEERMAERGLEPVLFTPNKGEVLLWHASLHHGGGPVTDERLTRKSMVVHYSTRRTYTSRSITVAERSPAGDEAFHVLETDRLIREGVREGFANPAAPERG